MAKRITINKIRGVLYNLAKILGDIQAITSPKKGSIQRRIGRRVVGKITGRMIGRIFR